MKRKEFIRVIDSIIKRLEEGENLYTCNEIDDICLGELAIESDMRRYYVNLMGKTKGDIPVGFITEDEYCNSLLFNKPFHNKEKSDRRVTALALFKESMLISGEYKGFDYEEE